MKKVFITIWVRYSGMIIAAIALAAVCGHVYGREELYNWNRSHAGMGLNTALEFLITGISFFLLATLMGER